MTWLFNVCARTCVCAYMCMHVYMHVCVCTYRMCVQQKV